MQALQLLRHYSPGISDLPPMIIMDWKGGNNVCTPDPQWDLEIFVI